MTAANYVFFFTKNVLLENVIYAHRYGHFVSVVIKKIGGIINVRTLKYSMNFIKPFIKPSYWMWIICENIPWVHDSPT